MNNLFISSGFWEAGLFKAANGSQIDFANLPPFLRVLLTTDGTVTKSLESFFWEPVRIVNLEQQYIVLTNAVPVLELLPGAEVLRRKVKLVGTRSKREFAVARSLIRTEILEPGVRADLEKGKIGIGELLRELGLETYREIVEIGSDPKQDSIWRCYRIMMNHLPLMQITEDFPQSVFS